MNDSGNNGNTNRFAKPFLKWAGGKSQLLKQFEKFYPPELKSGQIKKYIEPFVGSGAVFFDIVQKYPLESVYLHDVNEDLILTYCVIRNDPQLLIEHLSRHSKQYHKLPDKQRKDYYYGMREKFNRQRQNINPGKYSQQWAARAGQLIFLNKTCYNGLFRLNQRGGFNVPFGKYKNPKIIDEDNILRVSATLQNVEILYGDFTDCQKYAGDDTFIYFDPPYRPISQTSAFTSYSKDDFGDEQQRELAQLFKALDRRYNIKLMLSNSDPSNEKPGDAYFSNLYRDFHFYKVQANRMINCRPEKRGRISELVITNYTVTI
ncbi:MAG: DNA adenine methylase [Calditrichia bacterium]